MVAHIRPYPALLVVDSRAFVSRNLNDALRNSDGKAPLAALGVSTV